MLLDHVSELASADKVISALLTEELLGDILAQVPDEWLEPVPGAETAAALRDAYVRFLVARLSTRQWLPGVGA